MSSTYALFKSSEISLKIHVIEAQKCSLKSLQFSSSRTLHVLGTQTMLENFFKKTRLRGSMEVRKYLRGSMDGKTFLKKIIFFGLNKR